MEAIEVAGVVFVATGLCAGFGIGLRHMLPENHLNTDSREVMKLVMGLIATMAALVLGLLIASSKASFDQQREELQEVAASVLDLDRLLAHYGTEAKPARQAIYDGVKIVSERLRQRLASGALRTARPGEGGITEGAFEQIIALRPQSDGQRFLQERALSTATAIRHLRVLMTEQVRTGLPWTFLTVLIAWICLLFVGFGLFTRPNPTVIVGLAIGAVSVASALFLILEMKMPYSGLIHVSDGAFDTLLEQINR